MFCSISISSPTLMCRIPRQTLSLRFCEHQTRENTIKHTEQTTHQTKVNKYLFVLMMSLCLGQFTPSGGLRAPTSELNFDTWLTLMPEWSLQVRRHMIRLVSPEVLNIETTAVLVCHSDDCVSDQSINNQSALTLSLSLSQKQRRPSRLPGE